MDFPHNLVSLCSHTSYNQVYKSYSFSSHYYVKLFLISPLSLSYKYLILMACTNNILTYACFQQGFLQVFLSFCHLWLCSGEEEYCHIFLLKHEILHCLFNLLILECNGIQPNQHGTRARPVTWGSILNLGWSTLISPTLTSVVLQNVC